MSLPVRQRLVDPSEQKKIEQRAEELASIRKQGDSVQMTREEALYWASEIKKCKEDIVYFCEHYFYIISLDKGKILLKPYQRQVELLRAIQNNNRTICMAARQCGKTTIYTVFILWYTTFFSDKRVMICGNKMSIALEIMDRIRLAYEYLPSTLKRSVVTYNKATIEFSNDSKICAFATGASGCRGFSANCLTGDARVVIMDDFGGIYNTPIEKVSQIEEAASKECGGNYHYVYHTTNKLNGMEYIGVHSTYDLDDGYMGSGVELCKAIEHDGIENFEKEILEFFETAEEALATTHTCGSNPDDGSLYHSFSRKVLTADGFKEFHGVRRTEAKDLITFVLQNGSQLRCTPEHKIVRFQHGMTQAKDFKVNDCFEDGKGNPLRIVHIESKKADSNTLVYDLLNVGEKHEYIANGIRVSNCLILDEAAFIPKGIADEFMASVFPILSSSKDSKALMVSTPNGTANNLFYDIWCQANDLSLKTAKDNWKPFRFDWWEVPGRDEVWKSQQIKTIGIERWNQEFACEFRTSSSALLIPGEKIEEFRMKAKSNKDACVAQINLSPDPEKEVNATIWKNFSPTRTYLASGDISEGTGKDSSVVYIMDATEPTTTGIEIVAKVSTTNSTLVDFGYMANKLLRLYACPPFICENNGVGAGFIDILLQTYNYPSSRMFYQQKNQNEIRYGVKSSNSVKLEACMFARELCTTKDINLVVPDEALVDEMGSFIKKTTGTGITFNATSNAHDDFIMSWIWGLYLIYSENIEMFYQIPEAFKTDLGRVFPKVIRYVNSPDSSLVGEIVCSPEYNCINEQFGLSKGSVPIVKSDGTTTEVPAEQLYYGPRSFGGRRKTSKPFYCIGSSDYQDEDGIYSNGDSSWLLGYDDDNDWNG